MDNRSRGIPLSHENDEEVTRERDFQSIDPQSEATELRDRAQLFLPQNDPDHDEQQIYPAIIGRKDSNKANAKRTKRFVNRIPVHPFSSHIRRHSHSRGRSRSSRQTRPRIQLSPPSDKEDDWESEPEEDDNHDRLPNYSQHPIATAEGTSTSYESALVKWEPPASNEEQNLS